MSCLQTNLSESYNCHIVGHLVLFTRITYHTEIPPYIYACIDTLDSCIKNCVFPCYWKKVPDNIVCLLWHRFLQCLNVMKIVCIYTMETHYITINMSWCIIIDSIINLYDVYLFLLNIV